MSSTGLNRMSGASPHAAACIAWARPISPPRPSAPTTTTELLDMFCALNGATFTPRRCSQRQMPAVSTLLPASEVVPATSSPPLTVHLPLSADRAAHVRDRPAADAPAELPRPRTATTDGAARRRCTG